jgi:hypothetical protein
VLAYGTEETLPEYLPKGDAEYLIATQGGNAIEGNTAKVINLTLALGDCLQANSNSIIIAINVPSDNANKAEYKISAVKFYN